MLDAHARRQPCRHPIDVDSDVRALIDSGVVSAASVHHRLMVLTSHAWYTKEAAVAASQVDAIVIHAPSSATARGVIVSGQSRAHAEQEAAAIARQVHEIVASASSASRRPLAGAPTDQDSSSASLDKPMADGMVLDDALMGGTAAALAAPPASLLRTSASLMSAEALREACRQAGATQGWVAPLGKVKPMGAQRRVEERASDGDATLYAGELSNGIAVRALPMRQAGGRIAIRVSATLPPGHAPPLRGDLDALRLGAVLLTGISAGEMWSESELRMHQLRSGMRDVDVGVSGGATLWMRVIVPTHGLEGALQLLRVMLTHRRRFSAAQVAQAAARLSEEERVRARALENHAARALEAASGDVPAASEAWGGAHEARLLSIIPEDISAALDQTLRPGHLTLSLAGELSSAQFEALLLDYLGTIHEPTHEPTDELTHEPTHEPTHKPTHETASPPHMPTPAQAVERTRPDGGGGRGGGGGGGDIRGGCVDAEPVGATHAVVPALPAEWPLWLRKAGDTSRAHALVVGQAPPVLPSDSSRPRRRRAGWIRRRSWWWRASAGETTASALERRVGLDVLAQLVNSRLLRELREVRGLVYEACLRFNGRGLEGAHGGCPKGATQTAELRVPEGAASSFLSSNTFYTISLTAAPERIEEACRVAVAVLVSLGASQMESAGDRTAAAVISSPREPVAARPPAPATLRRARSAVVTNLETHRRDPHWCAQCIGDACDHDELRLAASLVSGPAYAHAAARVRWRRGSAALTRLMACVEATGPTARAVVAASAPAPSSPGSDDGIDA